VENGSRDLRAIDFGYSLQAVLSGQSYYLNFARVVGYPGQGHFRLIQFIKAIVD
jgi:hypothetical protein